MKVYIEKKNMQIQLMPFRKKISTLLTSETLKWETLANDVFMKLGSLLFVTYRHHSVQLWQGSHSNNEIKFQDIPVYSRMDRTNFRDFSDVVYHTSVAIDTLSTSYFGIFHGDGAFRSINS